MKDIRYTVGMDTVDVEQIDNGLKCRSRIFYIHWGMDTVENVEYKSRMDWKVDVGYRIYMRYRYSIWCR